MFMVNITYDSTNTRDDPSRFAVEMVHHECFTDMRGFTVVRQIGGRGPSNVEFIGTFATLADAATAIEEFTGASCHIDRDTLTVTLFDD